MPKINGINRLVALASLSLLEHILLPGKSIDCFHSSKCVSLSK